MNTPDSIQRMPSVLKVTDSILIKLLSEEDADALFSLVDQNRAYLRVWLPWLDSNTCVEDTQSFILSVKQQYNQGAGFMGGVFAKDSLVGMCGFHPTESKNASADIGYWLSESCQGEGIMTLCVNHLIASGFDTLPLNKVTLSIATENLASRKIAKRLGFVYEGVERQAEYLYGDFVDHAKYSLLRSEWYAKHKN